LKLGDFGIAKLKLGKKKGIPADLFNIMWSPRGFADGDQDRWLATDDIYQMGQLLGVLLCGVTELNRSQPSQSGRSAVATGSRRSSAER